MAEAEALALAARIGALVEPVFAGLEALGEEVRACRVRAKACVERDLAPLEGAVAARMRAHPSAVGMGYVAAPGVVAGQERFMAWWQRAGDDLARLRLNFDPASVDVYDYLDMEWYRSAERGGARNAFGPYVDYSGSGQYVVTASVPVLVDGEFVGVAGADLAMDRVERRLVEALRGCDVEAVLVNDESRVLAANTSRWVWGARITPPVKGRDGFEEVVAVPGGPGWVVAVTGAALSEG